jgi:hypothetical protein
MDNLYIKSRQRFHYSGSGIVSFDVGSTAIVFPERWGARGNASTVNTNAIQRAVNSLTRGVVVLQNGVYLSNDINLKEYVYIYIAAGSTLLQNGGGAERLIYIGNISNTGVFGNGTIDGNVSLSGIFNGHCIKIRGDTANLKNIIVKDVTIKNATAIAQASGDGINVATDDDGIYSVRFVKLINTHIADCERNGISFVGNVKDSLVDANTVYSVTTTGVDIEQEEDEQIPSNIIISNNNISECSRGIDIMGQNNIISKNSISGVAVGLHFAGHATKISKQNIALGNVVSSPTGHAIWVDNNNMGQNQINENSIFMNNAGGNGIYVGFGSSNSYNGINRNNVHDVANGFFPINLLAAGAGYQIIEDNNIILGSGEAVTGINLTTNKYNSVQRNNIVGNFTTGINAGATSGYNDISNNVLFGTMTTGINLNNSGNNRLINNQFFGTITTEMNNFGATDVAETKFVVTSVNFSPCAVKRCDRGRVYTNNGASAIVLFNLEAAKVGDTFSFARKEAFQVQIDPYSTENFRGQASGKMMYLDSAGANVVIKCFAIGVWDIVSSNGTITYET